jgi:two-component system, OmpR family, response regulator
VWKIAHWGAVMQSSESSTQGRAERVHLLLVEDDDDTRDLMALALRGAGFDVQPAASGREALDLLESKPYDLLVTDYDMPGMTGTEMLQVAAERGIVRDARSLIVTAHPSPKGTEGFPVVRKPLDLARFVALLRSFHAVGPEGLPAGEKQPN